MEHMEATLRTEFSSGAALVHIEAAVSHHGALEADPGDENALPTVDSYNLALVIRGCSGAL